MKFYKTTRFKCISRLSTTAFSLGVLFIGFFSPSAMASNLIDFKSNTISCEKFEPGNDYRNRDRKTKELLGLVEQYHFSDNVKRGIKGDSGSISGDLDYVLRKFPNHPLALLVNARHQMTASYLNGRTAESVPKECYFRYALQQAPDDPSTHLVIAIFYHEYKQYEIASRHYNTSIELAPGNPEVHYNYGLMLLENGNVKAAKMHADIAYSMGYPLQGLKRKLTQASN